MDDLHRADARHFVQLSRQRAALYHRIARLVLAPPDEDAVSDLRRGAGRAFLDLLAAAPGAGTAVAAMRGVLEHGTARQAAARIGAAHALLFDGAGGPESVPPYRSVFSDPSGLLCREATAQMERLLRQHRLRLDPHVHEPADHLAIQLEAMAQLVLRSAEAVECGDLPPDETDPLLDEQASFAAAQLASWMPALAARIAGADPTGWHAGLAAALAAFVESDLAYLRAPQPA